MAEDANRDPTPTECSLMRIHPVIRSCLMLSLLLPAQAVAQMTVAQVEAIVRDYLLRHPEVIQQALNMHARNVAVQELARQQAALDEHYEALTRHPDSPVAGNPEGRITLVEFFDFRCQHCRSADGAIAQLLREDRDLRIVYKQFPLMGVDSALGARAALAAARQQRYSPMHEALMAAEKIDLPGIQTIAMKLGLDMERFQRDLDSDAITLQLQEEYNLAQTLGISGTPSFVVGRTLVSGASDTATLKALIQLQRELAATRAWAASSTSANP